MGEYDPFDETANMTKKGWLTAILELGAWLGTLLSGFMAEVLSRKYGIIVACFVFLLGVIIQAVSRTSCLAPHPSCAGGPATETNGVRCASVLSKWDPMPFSRADSSLVWASVLWP